MMMTMMMMIGGMAAGGEGQAAATQSYNSEQGVILTSIVLWVVTLDECVCVCVGAVVGGQ